MTPVSQRIKKELLVSRGAKAEPRRLHLGQQRPPPNLVAIAAGVALLSLVATAVFGMLGALPFIAATAVLVILAPASTGRDLLAFLPLLLLPLLAISSTIWSDAPERTLRAALQLLATFVAAIVVCRRIDARLMILLLFVGFAALNLLILPEAIIAAARRMPLYSRFLGSKNQVGFAAHILVALALAVMIDRRQPMIARLVSLPFIPMALIFLILAQSAGAQTSLAITFITFPAFMLFGRVNMSARVTLLILAIVVAGVALILLPDLQLAWADFRVNVLKKDATLTGRTYLWDVAARLNSVRPWLGGGYYSFWRQGNIDAEGLWRWGGIASRTGFNFHNAYIEMQVDLGWIGLGLFILSCVAIGGLNLARQMLRPSVPSAFLLSMLVVIYVRGYTESTLIAPFSLMAVLWIAAAVYSVDRRPFAGLREAGAPPLRGRLPQMTRR